MVAAFIYLISKSTRIRTLLRSLSFFFYESPFRSHETSESAHGNRIVLKPLSTVEFFGSDGLGEFVWTTETGYF